MPEAILRLFCQTVSTVYCVSVCPLCVAALALKYALPLVCLLAAAPGALPGAWHLAPIS